MDQNWVNWDIKLRPKMSDFHKYLATNGDIEHTLHGIGNKQQ